MIHFVAPHVEKIRAKVPELIRQVDVILGNLEDAIPATEKEAARAGFIELARANEFGRTGLWTRINALNSPWVLDDIVEIMAAVGNKLDVIILPKVEGAWDIHYLDQLLAQLEAKHGVTKPVMIHALLETAEGVNNVEEIAGASPRMHGMSLGPADLAASRAMKTTRVGGGHPSYGVLADPAAAMLRVRALSISKIFGITQSVAWSMPVRCMASNRSTARSEIFRTPQLVRPNSAIRFFRAAREPGRFIRRKSRSRGAFSLPIRPRPHLQGGSWRPCPTALARSWSTGKCRTTQLGSRRKSWLT